MPISPLTQTKTRLSMRLQTLWAMVAIVAAVVLPQIFHGIGLLTGTGATLGRTLLPMHLPIILVGLLAGPFAGAIAGLLAPAVSFVISGMPALSSLPFMMIELCTYGLVAGLLCKVKMHALVKVVIAQISGRAVCSLAAVVAASAVGYTAYSAAAVWTTTLVAGLPGLLLQWLVLPILAQAIQRRVK